MKWFKRGALLFGLVMGGPLYMGVFGNISLGNDWRTADRTSAGIAPDARTVREAVVQVYAARAFSWRGIFAVHTWIATKPRDAEGYSVHEVLGWRAYRGQPVVSSARDVPDRNWYGARPEVLVDIRGSAAEALIPQIEEAARSYPYPETYTLWPGPNSNTFTAWVARELPELGLDLPTTAIGKDYLGNARFVASAPSGTGYQLSVFGVLGVAAAKREGLEFNLLGFNFGLDPLGMALKLPGIGRLGGQSGGSAFR